MSNERSTIESVAVVKQTTASGVVAWLAPDLNFFTLQTISNPVTGTTERYFNIRTEAPPAELLIPPVDAAVVYLTEPGGIVRGSR